MILIEENKICFAVYPTAGLQTQRKSYDCIFIC